MFFLNNIFKQRMIILIIFCFILTSFSLTAQLTITVNTTADSGPGSFREAINNATGNDTIVFSGLTYPDTIRLTSGQINISNVSVIILGPGSDSLSISGERLSRIFTFSEGDAEAHGLSFNNGYVYGFQNGGAFDVSAGGLSLFDCIVSFNEAVGDSISLSSAGLGGAFYVTGQLNLVRTTVFNNKSTGGFGNDGYGGAIYQSFGTTTIINSTISGNNVQGGPAAVGANSGIGGALAIQAGTVNILSSTIAFNDAVDGAGGGIFKFAGGTVTSRNSIVARNTSPTDPDVFGNFTSLGFNLITDIGTSSGWVATDLIGVNPELDRLKMNGGPTPTHLLLPLSFAIDAGDTSIVDSIDQRGFPRIQDGNGDDIAVIDIGAYEAVVPSKPTNLTATHGDRSAILDWQYVNVSAIAQFNIYRDSTLIGNVPSNTLSFTDVNLINGQTYFYNISAVDTIGFESSFSLPVSTTPNGPPQWSIPAGLITFDEDDSLTIDLDDYLFDDSHPDSVLSVNIIPGSSVMISLNPGNHVARFTAPPNYFGMDTAFFVAVDPEMLSTSDTVNIIVNSVNDLPEITSIPDTSIFTYTDFNYQVDVSDLEGDSLLFSDNTNIFNIDSSGLIAFRPTMSDTGNHAITIFAADNDTTVSDTFNLNIQLSVVNPPFSLNVTSLDQALNFSWTNPINTLNPRTRIVMRKYEPITHPDSGIVALDTVFASPGNASAIISNLDIADTYYFMIFNYFRENTDIILSNFVTGSDSTLSPQVSVDLSLRNFSVLNGTTYDTSIVIINDGGGTLLSKFSYNPTALQSVWFLIDSTVQTVAPFSSVNVPMQFTIPDLVTDTLLSIGITIETNQPGWQNQTIDINVNNVFDRFAPLVSPASEPDSIVRQAAVRFQFSVNDTMNARIGDFPEELFTRYALFNFTTNQFVFTADSLHTNEIVLYPLTDGEYGLSLWVYDRSGNGKQFNEEVYNKRFNIIANQKILPKKNWLLSSIPRDQNYTFANTASDSDFVIFRWNPMNEEYDQIKNKTLENGFGYWIYSAKRAYVNVNHIPFTTNNDSVLVPIVQGWNQIGIPMPFKVNMNKVSFVQENTSITSAISLTQAVSDSLIAPAIYWYRAFGNQSGYEWGGLDTTFAEPWRGYWIYSHVNGNFIYSKEPSFRSPSITPTDIPALKTDIWEAILSIDCGDLIDSKNIIGTKLGKYLNIFEPPVLSNYVSLYFKSGNNKLAGMYQSPLKDLADVKRYDVFVETSEINKSHLIKWNLPENNAYFYLVDNYSEKIINMREESEYSITPTTNTQGMIIYATYDADFEPGIIPVEFKLKQNYPNPFNPITTIEFGIPENGKDNVTTLKIFNILGQEINTLIKGRINSGYHKISWNGLNSNNQKVASGLYFYSLSNGKTELFKKMIFIK